MNCFICERSGEVRRAVGLCRHCEIALCVEHLGEGQASGPGGMSYACKHPLRSTQEANIYA